MPSGCGVGSKQAMYDGRGGYERRKEVWGWVLRASNGWGLAVQEPYQGGKLQLHCSHPELLVLLKEEAAKSSAIGEVGPTCQQPSAKHSSRSLYPKD